jgi:hypothetical protein
MELEYDVEYVITKSATPPDKKGTYLTKCCPSTVTAPPTANRDTKIGGHAMGNVVSNDTSWIKLSVIDMIPSAASTLPPSLSVSLTYTTTPTMPARPPAIAMAVLAPGSGHWSHWPERSPWLNPGAHAPQRRESLR